MQRKTTLAIVAIAAELAIAPLLVNGAYAAITSHTTNSGCTNNGGNSPGGQQPTCTGSGLTQQQTTTNVNPAGSAPPGQNK
jgi:hypothetical protein